MKKVLTSLHYRTHSCGELTAAHADQTVILSGWVNVRRDHGKIIFIDLRDHSGIVQVVFTPACQHYTLAERLRSEWVVRIEGAVKMRPEKMVNPKSATGTIEVEAIKLEIVNEALPAPFPIDTDGYEINEETRMRYRYLDLRRSRLARNIAMRSRTLSFMRNWLTEQGFTEVETPVLTKSTPEGARDYVVPSRLYPGAFYALPQSPQQYKQLLMMAGLERYFQFARCFRDEDTRGDRQPEFTQLDLEMSFVMQEDVMKLNEQLLIEIVQKLYPEKKIQEIPFPRITYKEAMEKYGTDRPDLRADKNNPNVLAFCWVKDFPFFEKTDTEGWTFTHNPFSAAIPEHEKWLMNKSHIGEIVTTQYDVVLNGLEIGGGSIRSHKAEILTKVFEIMGFSQKEIETNFGHMLTALQHGAPPHGGIAWGFDRLISILCNEPNIREVIAFPKTGDARDLLMNAPAPLSKEQLRELQLKVATASRRD